VFAKVIVTTIAGHVESYLVLKVLSKSHFLVIYLTNKKLTAAKRTTYANEYVTFCDPEHWQLP
jgi:hypothetical protein